MTYLTAQELGLTDWVEKSEARGYMWCTPGPYLRKSMLRVLASEVSDNFLPEAFYTDNTFTRATDNPARSSEEERVLAMSLGMRINDEERSRERNDDTDDDDTDEEDE